VLALIAGSTATVQFSNFCAQLAVNSGAISLAIVSNDFSDASATVVASGTPSDTIDLRNNYWGTTDVIAIASKITDHNDDAARPTVLFKPPLVQRPTQTLAASLNVPFNTAAQSVTLTANVTSPSGAVSGGTVTFTVASG